MASVLHGNVTQAGMSLNLFVCHVRREVISSLSCRYWLTVPLLISLVSVLCRSGLQFDVSLKKNTKPVRFFLSFFLFFSRRRNKT